MRRLTLILAALCIPAKAWGQLANLAPGSRVRVEAPALFRGRVVGTIMDNMRDSVVLAVPVPGARPDTAGAVRRYVLTGSSVQRVELSRGSSHWRAATRGAKLGMILGLTYTVVGAVVAGSEVPPVIVVAFGAVATTAAGAAGGAIASIFTIEQWSPVQP